MNKKKTVSSEIREMRNLYTQASQAVQTFKEMTNSRLVKPNGLDPQIHSVLRSVELETIDKFTFKNCMNVLRILPLDPIDNSSCYKKACEAYRAEQKLRGEEIPEDFDFAENPEWTAWMKNIFKEIKKEDEELEELEKSKREIKENIEKIERDYIGYVSSDEYIQRKKEALEKRRESAENAPNTYLKNKTLKEVDAAMNAPSLEFLFERIDKVGKKEVEAIKNAFFDKRKSNIDMTRFQDKIRQFGFQPGIYRSFFNIEEIFLPDEYNKFNNLFLYHVMRFVSHLDASSVTDKLYATTVMQKMYHLMYHKFRKNEEEQEMIAVVKRFDDLFQDYADYFVEKNILSPDHEHRKAKQEEVDQEERARVIDSLIYHGVEPDTTLETEELAKQLREIVEKKKEEKQSYFEKQVAEATKIEEDEPEEQEEKPVKSKSVIKRETVQMDEHADPLENVVADEKSEETTVEETDAVEEDSEEENDMSEVITPKEGYSTAEAVQNPSTNVAEETPAAEENAPFDITKIKDDERVYIDASRAFYVQVAPGLFNCYSNGEILEENVPETDVLRLASSGFVVKGRYGDIKRS